MVVQVMGAGGGGAGGGWWCRWRVVGGGAGGGWWHRFVGVGGGGAGRGCTPRCRLWVHSRAPALQEAKLGAASTAHAPAGWP